MAAAPGGNPTGKVGSAVNAARTLADPNASAADKAVEGAAVAAQVATTAAAGTVAGAVVGQAVRSRGGRKLLTAAAAALALLLVGGVATVGFAVQAASTILLEEEDSPPPPSDSTCLPGGIGIPIGGASGLSTEQQANATAILGVVQQRGLNAGDAIIAIMTALTESSLINVNHGDLAGPDSRGLFQQRDSWGPLEVRMDPAGATGLFLDRLVAPGLMQYEGLGSPKTVEINADGATSRGKYEPWRVAQSVQISAFPMGENYRAQYANAVRIVSEMLGADALAGARVDYWAAHLGPGDPPVNLPAAADDTEPVDEADPEAPDDAAGEEGTDPADTDGGEEPAGAPPAPEPCDQGPPPADGPGPGAWGNHQNGMIPSAALCTLSWQQNILLRCDAAAQLEQLNARFRADLGHNLSVGQGYRDLQTQQCMYGGGCGATGPAARPGTSNHGWALAIDINGTAAGNGSYEARKTTPVYRWMAANAPTYLFRENVSLREAWHWEYHGAWTG